MKRDEPLQANVRTFDERADRDLARVKAASARSPFSAEPTAYYVKLTSAASIPPRAIQWVWPWWLARGKLHVLAGSPGTGKTTIAMHIAACVTSGQPLPSGERPEVGNVLVWSGEDDPADTLVPRLKAAKAELSRVHFIGDVYRGQEVQRSFDPAHDVEVLAAAAAKLDNVALLIVDPLVSAVSGDSHRNAEVRRGLQPLVELADKLGAALIGITHYSKGTQGGDPLERVTGSVAFGAMARVVYGTVRMKAENGETARMVFARAKSNIGPDGGGFAYSFQQCEIEGSISTSYIEWGEQLAGTARDLLAEPEQQDDQRTETSAAGTWLRELLKDGPKLVKDIKKLVLDTEFSWRTMQRASKNTGVILDRGGFQQPATWSLPGAEWLPPSRATSAPVAPVAPAQNLGSTADAGQAVSASAPAQNLGATGAHGATGATAPKPPLPAGGHHG